MVIPEDITPGAYVVSWRWDCEETAQVFAVNLLTFSTLLGYYVSKLVLKVLIDRKLVSKAN